MITRQLKTKFQNKYEQLRYSRPDFIDWLQSQNPEFISSSYDDSHCLFSFGYLLVSVHPYGVEYFLGKQI
jgi:hypothetical protein